MHKIYWIWASASQGTGVQSSIWKAAHRGPLRIVMNVTPLSFFSYKVKHKYKPYNETFTPSHCDIKKQHHSISLEPFFWGRRVHCGGKERGACLLTILARLQNSTAWVVSKSLELTCLPPFLHQKGISELSLTPSLLSRYSPKYRSIKENNS